MSTFFLYVCNYIPYHVFRVWVVYHSLSFCFSDPFDTPKPLVCHNRTQSAPATVRVLRQKSARIYREVPVIKKRAMTALPTTSIATRELFTGPVS